MVKQRGKNSNTDTKGIFGDRVINDYQTNELIGIILWDNKTLQEITQKSGTLANSCEYQVHYWSLNIQKRFDDGTYFVIHIPTTIFNYRQEVSGAAIDFELSDVQNVSNTLKEIQELEVAKLYPLVKDKFPDFEFHSVSLNTLHRHP